MMSRPLLLAHLSDPHVDLADHATDAEYEQARELVRSTSARCGSSCSIPRAPARTDAKHGATRS
jgi:hypothetical protein